MKRISWLRQARTRAGLNYGSNLKPLRHGSSSKKSDSQGPCVEIRPAKASDSGFITELSLRVFQVYGPYGDTVSQWFESGTTLTLIALIDGKSIGFAMIGNLSNDTDLGLASELLAIAIEPERQRMGMGEILLKEIERRAIDLKVRRLFLHTAKENILAQRLFTRNGYHPWWIEKRFYPAGQDAVVMSKEIGWERPERVK